MTESVKSTRLRLRNYLLRLESVISLASKSNGIGAADDAVSPPSEVVSRYQGRIIDIRSPLLVLTSIDLDSIDLDPTVRRSHRHRSLFTSVGLLLT